LDRHKLVSRRPTTVCQKPPEFYQDKIIDFIMYVDKLRRKVEYSFIFAADETAVYIDFSNSLTVAEKGAKEVGFRDEFQNHTHFLGASFDYRTR